MEPIIHTSCGKIKGIDQGSYYEYRGIPFARPPVGRLRFKEPVCCTPWEGVYEADTFKDGALQTPPDSHMPLYGKEFYSVPAYNRNFSEDCLYLNIWCPKNALPGTCPVALWIHGGAFHHGYSSEMEFDGEAYCKRNVILVTAAYRLGPLGFLSIPELEAEDGHSGNYGLLDQIAALKWVRDNISFFGGDPGNITLFGQSAGAASVLFLCCSEMTRGLFHKAIMQSGAGYGSELIQVMDREKKDRIYNDLLKALKIRTYEELEALPSPAILKAYDEMDCIKAGDFLCPCVDNYVLTASPDQLMAEGRMHNIPYILGSNKDDLLADAASAEKPGGKLWETALRFAGLCEKQGKISPYLYYFAHDLPGSNDGAFHSAELWYVFGTLKRCWRPMKAEDLALSEQILDYWCAFMHQGDPNPSGDQRRWNSFKDGGCMIFL